jgi:hypothetical protein
VVGRFEHRFLEFAGVGTGVDDDDDSLAGQGTQRLGEDGAGARAAGLPQVGLDLR